MMEKDNSIKSKINAETIIHYEKNLREIRDITIDLKDDLLNFHKLLTSISLRLRKIPTEEPMTEDSLKYSILILTKKFKKMEELMEKLSDDNFEGMPTFYGEEDLDDRQD